MSERELKRVAVLSEVHSGHRTVAAAASLLDLSERQAYRLLARYQEDGGFGLAHKARGRVSNRSHNAGIRQFAVDLVKANYRDFGPTLATEALEQRHSLRVGRETLRRWMMAEGVWLSRKQRKTFHQPRLRREGYGELVQIDGSDHRWFEGRADPCTLLVFVDDATSKLMQLRFVRSESTETYFEALRGYLNEHGCPVAFYSDRHSVFRPVNPNTKGLPAKTQFSRALGELNIEIICANSSQAKGRVERANRTLQDRLVKELRLAGISDTEAGNAFLPDFMGRHNQRFAVPPARRDDLHRRLGIPTAKLDDILCHREQRYVGAQLTLSYDRKQIILEQTTRAKGLAGQYVDLYDFEDRTLEVRWKGYVLPYRVFDKDQRVNETAIVENKRLGHALAFVKAQQDVKLRTKVLTNSEMTGYIKSPRRKYGPDFIEKERAPNAVEMWKSPKNGDSAHPHRTTTATDLH
jgi:transposase